MAGRAARDAFAWQVQRFLAALVGPGPRGEQDKEETAAALCEMRALLAQMRQKLQADAQQRVPSGSDAREEGEQEEEDTQVVLDVLQEQLDSCELRLLHSIRAETQLAVRARECVTATVKDLKHRRRNLEAATPGGDREMQRHVVALVNLMGEWSNLLSNLMYMAHPALRMPGCLDMRRVASTLVAPLHESVCETSVLCLQTFRKEKNLSLWERMAQSYAQRMEQQAGGHADSSAATTNHNSTDTGMGMDAQQLDFLLDQIACMCQVVKRYMKFVGPLLYPEHFGGMLEYPAEVAAAAAVTGAGAGAGAGAAAVPQPPPTAPPAAPQSEQPHIVNGLDRHLQDWLELEGTYVNLEELYCASNLADRVMQERGVVEVLPNVLVAAKVEDGFLLMTKSFERSLTTLSETCALAVCTRVVELLDEDTAAGNNAGVFFRHVNNIEFYTSEYIDVPSAAAGGDAGHTGGGVDQAPLSGGSTGDAGAQAGEAGTGIPAPPESSDAAAEMLLRALEEEVEDPEDAVTEDVLLLFANSLHVCESSMENLVELLNPYAHRSDEADVPGEENAQRIEEPTNAQSPAEAYMPSLNILCEQCGRIRGLFRQRLMQTARNIVADAYRAEAVREAIQQQWQRLQYEISGSQYESLIITTPLAHFLSAQLDACLLQHRHRLLEGVTQCLAEEAITLLTTDLLDLLVHAGRFSEWGAQLFHHEIRSFRHRVESLFTVATLGNAFLVLDTASSVLSCDHPSELVRYVRVNRAGVEALGMSTVATLLARRTEKEFAPSIVQAAVERAQTALSSHAPSADSGTSAGGDAVVHGAAAAASETVDVVVAETTTKNEEEPIQR